MIFQGVADAATVKSPLKTKPAKVGFSKQVFGTVGVTSPAKKVTLVNKGDVPIALVAFAVDGDFALDAAGSDCSPSLAPGAQCGLAVTFTPTGLGTRTGTLTITDDAVGSPHLVALKGKGVLGKLVFTPGSLKFAGRAPGSATVQTLVVRNPNPVPVPITGIVLAGDDFAIDSRSCGSVLAAGAECSIDVGFRPTAVGGRKGTLRFAARAAKTSPKVIALKGKGLALCDGVKTKLATDPDNCGACGNHCPGTCVDGQCQDGSMVCGIVTPDLCTCDFGSTCTSVLADRNNCGGCGDVCYAGQSCQNGVCTGCTTAAAPDQCGALCTSLQTDPFNCGGCGVACASGLCVGGVCSSCGPTAPHTCDGACTDVTADEANCGGCGNVCPAGTPCVDGACAGIACAAATPDACGTRCTNLATDADHCGVCGIDCGDAPCVQGQCISCGPDAPYRCGGDCVDLAIDDVNCGACGNVCPAGSACSGGTCRATVCNSNGTSLEARAAVDAPIGSRALVCGGSTPNPCGKECVDLQTDSFNCGSCGTFCASGRCVGGTCLDCKGATPDVCGNQCVDIFSDKGNCGGCGHACGADEGCLRGICQHSDVCNGVATHTNLDRNNCGSCGHVCTEGPCVRGECRTLDCRGVLNGMNCHGVCIDVARDHKNCGACDVVCAAGDLCTYPSNGSPRCSQCSYPTPDDCDGLCTNLQHDPHHCQTCGQQCPSGTTCFGDRCSPCGDTSTLCGGECVFLASDHHNCGACSNDCGSHAQCDDRVCAPCLGSATAYCPAASISQGGGSCTNLSSDASNCGGCGHVCESPQKCIAGKCRGCIDPDDPFCLAPCESPKPDACGAECVDFKSDAKNCGGCGNECPSGSCELSKCKPGNCGAFRVSEWAGTVSETSTDLCGGTASLALNESVDNTLVLTPSATVPKGCDISGALHLTQNGSTCGQWAGLWTCGGTVNDTGAMSVVCSCLTPMSGAGQLGLNSYTGSWSFFEPGEDSNGDEVNDTASGTFRLQRK